MNPKGRRALAGSGAALVLTGAAIVAQAFALPVLAAPSRAEQGAASTGWRVSASLSVRGQFALFADIDADSGRDAWATGFTAGDSGENHAVIEHWTGKAWRRVLLPAKLLKGIDQKENILSTIGAASAHDVWTFTVKGQYLRLTGSTWTRGRLPRLNGGRLVPQSVKVFGPDDVWVIGYRNCSPNSISSGCHPAAAKFNGRSWRMFRLPGRGILGEVSELSADDIWAVIGPDEIVHWNGTAWRVPSARPTLPAKTDLSAITAISDSDIWVGGTAANSKHGGYELIRHWNGRAWVNVSSAARQTPNQPIVESLVPDGSGGIWELADTGNYEDSSRLRHFSHGRWVATDNVDWLLIQLTAVPGTTSTWGVGTSENISRGLIVLHGPRPR